LELAKLVSVVQSLEPLSRSAALQNVASLERADPLGRS
jgi:hypothetical protein